MSLAETFRAEALRELQARVAHLRQSLTWARARALPEAQYQDVVVAAREVLLTTFRQVDMPAPGHVLVTVQIARHGLGGPTTFKIEGGLVLSSDGSVRDATDEELLRSGA